MSIDLDLQLHEFCDLMDETQGALTIDDILERTGEVPVIPGRWIAVRGRPISRRVITAAAAVMVVVLIGLALRFVPGLQRDVPPATDDIPTTTTSNPPREGADAVGGGTMDTPLGTFSWRHLTGDQSSLPDPSGGGLVATPSGFAAIGRGVDPLSGTTVGFQYWRSLDGFQWTQEPMPIPAAPESARLVRLENEVWLMTFNPGTLWRSIDGEVWSEVSVPGTSLEWELLEGADGIWLMGSGLWRLNGSEWVGSDTRPPWASNGNQANLITIVATDDRFLAFVETEDSVGSPQLRQWTSDNAIDWEGPELPDIARSDHMYQSFSDQGDMLVAEFDYAGSTHVFVSEDGVTWLEELAQNSGQLRPLIRFDTGWIYIDEDAGSMWVSVDLHTWRSAESGVDRDSLAVGPQPDGGRRDVAGYGAGNMIFLVSSTDETGKRDMWVWKLDP